MGGLREPVVDQDGVAADRGHLRATGGNAGEFLVRRRLGGAVSQALQEWVGQFLRGQPRQLLFQRHALDVGRHLVANRSHHGNSVEAFLGSSHPRSLR